MNTTLRTAFAVSALALMAACGGGSGVSSVPAPTSAPTSNPATPAPTTAAKPASNSTADLVKFAQGGVSETLRDDVLRVSRDFEGGSVAYDTVAGGKVGLVTYERDNAATDFRIKGAAQSDIVVGSGNYAGPLSVTYALGDGAVRAADGEFSASVDFKNQTVATGGIVGNARNNIEFFGNANIVNGAINDNDTVVRLRDGEGKFIRNYTGTTNGVFTNGSGNTDALVGTVGSADLNMKGGFVITGPSN
jgi:hypothetical protein